MQAIVGAVLREIDWETALAPGGVSMVSDLALGSAQPRRSVIETIAALLKLSPNRSESAECPYWGEDRIQALDADLLRALAEGAVVTPIPTAAFARIVDVAWLRRACTHELVIRGIEAYLTLGAAFDPDGWHVSYDHLRRAVQLSAQLRRGSSAHAQLLADVAALVERVGASDSGYFASKAMHVLIGQRYPNGATLADLAGKIARVARAECDHYRARDYLNTQLAWHRLYADRAGERAALVAIADILESHADREAQLGRPGVAAHHQAEAVVSWRRLGERGRSQSAHVKLQRLQRDGRKELHAIRSPGEIAPGESGKRLANMPRDQAVLELALLTGPASVASLKNQALERLRTSPVRSMIPHVLIGQSGRSIHVSKTATASDDKERAEALVDEARSDCLSNIEHFVIAELVPATSQVQLDHNLTTAELMPLVERSAFVPSGRRWSFARGLALGFQGDFVVAAHLLMPQFENALRALLEARGAVVSSVPSSGVQSEVLLGGLLTLRKAIQLLGEDEHFELETLLVRKAGANLRNELAHGLFDDGGRGALLVYFWWKVLRYVVVLTVLEDLASVPRPSDNPDQGGG